MAYNTKNRQQLLEIIKNQKDRYIAIDEINATLEKQNIKMSLSTIYRYIDYLQEENLVSQYIDVNDKKSYFRYIGDNPDCKQHLHLKCTQCGITIHLPPDALNQDNTQDFKIEYNSSIINGICKNCQ